LFFLVIFLTPADLFSLALESAILMSRGVDGTLGVFEKNVDCGLRLGDG
jgi:hypothetical protein